MATIDQQFVEYIVKTLVNEPDKVVVERTIDEKGVLLSLTVAPEDVGRVIGKRGATAQSIRALLRALGTKQDARYNLKIMDSEDLGIDRSAMRHAEPETVETEEAIEEVDASDDESVEIEETVEVEETPAETSELAEKTRAELADLDDLDI